MTMLIKGGLLHTMTSRGSFVGDILVQSDRITAVAPELAMEGESSACVLDAKGLTVLPGMIDAHIHDGPAMEESILQSPGASGVTAGLLWPEEDAPCSVLTQEGKAASTIYALQSTRYTDAQLHARFLALAEERYRPACEISNPGECRRVLAAVHSSRVKAILIHLNGCEEMAEAIALSGCPVIMGVSSARGSSPWAMARRLNELAVPVSLTCNYPDAKLRHLPLCAALCAREGMDREGALHTVTTAPAALMGLAGAGRIEEGCRADFAIYDGDPLLLATSHVMTISGGKIRH